MAASTRAPSIIVGLVIAAVAALSIWYLARPQPLLVQGEVDETRFDIAARVDGRVAEIPVVRGQDVAGGAVLVRIDNPETIAKNEQALAGSIRRNIRNLMAGQGLPFETFCIESCLTAVVVVTGSLAVGHGVFERDPGDLERLQECRCRVAEHLVGVLAAG